MITHFGFQPNISQCCLLIELFSNVTRIIYFIAIAIHQVELILPRAWQYILPSLYLDFSVICIILLIFFWKDLTSQKGINFLTFINNPRLRIGALFICAIILSFDFTLVTLRTNYTQNGNILLFIQAIIYVVILFFTACFFVWERIKVIRLQKEILKYSTDSSKEISHRIQKSSIYLFITAILIFSLSFNLVFFGLQLFEIPMNFWGIQAMSFLILNFVSLLQIILFSSVARDKRDRRYAVSTKLMSPRIILKTPISSSLQSHSNNKSHDLSVSQQETVNPENSQCEIKTGTDELLVKKTSGNFLEPILI